QSADLVMSLSAQGADAAVFPCLAVVPPEDPAAVLEAVRGLADHDGVIVSSPNGVQALFGAMDEAGLDVRALAGKTVAAIGSGTAAACRRHGIIADLVPDRARAEGLVDALREAGLLGQRWLHVRADEGRPLLGEAIEAAGGRYGLVIGYRTVRPEVSPRLLLSMRAPDDGGEGFDAIVFASGKTARHFLETLGDGLGPDVARARLEAAKVVCLGPVTTAAVEAMGIRVDATAREPTDDAVVEALLGVLGR
ncbi:MAG: uroporphyrinogen-III synthase, partial [Nannocystaceae bacterium]